MSRTEWAEREVEELLAIPFLREFVFRDLETSESRRKEQVADFLIQQGRLGILIEQKCQDDPSARGAAKTALWARKKAKEGFAQIRRAFTRSKRFPVYCTHPRRGLVEFSDGLPVIKHAIVALEVNGPVDLRSENHDPALEVNGVPVTYLTLNDLLNLAVQLRSFPELSDYLTARRTIGHDTLCSVGEEKTIFSLYLLGNGVFAPNIRLEDARREVLSQAARLEAAVTRKLELDRHAYLMERVADQFATRNPGYAKGLPPDLAALYESDDGRQSYLEMQSALSALRLRERGELGLTLSGTVERISLRDRGFVFRTVQFDSSPDWVFVVGASRNEDRVSLLNRMRTLVSGALSYYKKAKCLVVIDRDCEGFELALSKPGFEPTPTDQETGQRLFGALRITSTPLRFLPDPKDVS